MKSENRLILRDSSFTFLIQGFNIIIGLVQNIIIVRSLEVSDLGRYQLLLAFLGIAQIFTLPGTSFSLMKASVKSYDRIIPKLFVQSLVAAVIVTVSMLIFLPFANFIPVIAKYKDLLFVCALFLPFIALEKYESVLQGKREFILSRKIIGINNLSSLIMVGGAAMISHSIKTVIIVYFINRVIIAFVGMYFVVKLTKNCDYDREFENELRMQSKQQTLLAIFGMMVSQADKIILGVLDKNLLAIYTVGANIPIKIKDNAKNLLSVPVLYWGNKAKQEHFESVQRYGVPIFFAGILLSLLLIVASPILVPLLYGDRYVVSIPVNQLMSTFISFNFVSTLVISADLIQNKGKFYAIVNIIRNSLYIILLVILIANIKIYGVVSAFLICELVVFFACIGFYFRELKKIRTYKCLEV